MLTVAIREETLVELLAQRYLSAEELFCPTPRAHQRLRKVLLRALMPVAKRG
ncbi:hypothetical protein P3339_22745 [Microbulbifer sp. MLAF003]|uniref:hypothetical protein n=1 Tax=Microbulbifer TaxID=48073 RepID=UPI00039CE3EC|nr:MULTISPECIES: hypothetical protein [Microbulbifer]WHI51181.1 hypothetical protein P3339_22745 [Microbulbifer sp. MLAF003]